MTDHVVGEGVTYRLCLDGQASGPLEDVPGFGSRVPVPAVIDFADVGGCTVRFTLEAGPSGLVVREVRFTALPGTEVTGTSLRAVRLAELLRFARRYLGAAEREYRDIGRMVPATLTLFGADDIKARMKDDGAWTDEDYYPPLVFTRDGARVAPTYVLELRKLGLRSERTARTVAAMYRLGESEGRPPMRFVQELFGLKASTASDWIKAARSTGALPERDGA